MNTFKNIISWLSLYLVGTLFFFTAGFFALISVVNPDTIKHALSDEGVYTAIVPAVIKTTANTNVSTGVVPIKEPWVQDAANTAFPAADLQQKAETVIDSTFAWLEGKTEQPEFSIDLSSNKARFGDEVGKYAQSRYDGLEPCTRANIPTNTDALTINCKLPGINATSLASTISQQVSSDPDFLPNPVLSSDNASLNPVGQQSTTDSFSQFESVRSVYQHKDLLSWALPLLTVGFAMIGLFLARNRVNGLKRLSRSFLMSALSLIVIGLILGAGLTRLVDALAVDAITETVIGPIVRNLGEHAKTAYFVFAGIAVAISVGTYIASRILRNRIKTTPQAGLSETPQSPFGDRTL